MTKVRAGLRKEQETSDELHDAVEAAVRRREREEPGFRERLDRAYAYAVFPLVGRASAALGGSYGLGEVYRQGRLIGYAGLIQVTLGVQLGGQTFTEFVLFDTSEALERFKAGELRFASNASAVVAKAGAAVTNDGKGSEIRLYSKGGFQIEAALGGQKFIFRPAALTRWKTVEHVEEQRPAE